MRAQAASLPDCDFFETTTPSDTRQYVLAAIERTSRRIRVLGGVLNEYHHVARPARTAFSARPL